jgi:hypothetical protein
MIKFILITVLTLIYIAAIFIFVVPFITNQAYGQSAFDATNQFQQTYPQQQYGMQQPYQDQYSSGFNSYQQPYGSTPYYGQQYGMQQPYYGQQQYGAFGIQEIIAMILTGGAGAAGGKYAADRKTKRLEELHRETMEAELKTKEQLKELARVTYNMNTDKANQINDAPTVQLDELAKDVDNFREKTAKA